MARRYALSTFLRQTPNALLEAYFHQRGLLTDHTFRRIKPTDAHLIIAAMETLYESERAEVEAEFRDIYILADEKGSLIIAEQLDHTGHDAASKLESVSNPYALAMWLFMEHGPRSGRLDLFSTCATLAHIRSLSFPRSKRKTGLPQQTPRSDPKTLRALAEGIKAAYRPQGRAYRCKVEHYVRPNPIRHIFHAFPEDYACSELGYDGDELTANTRRPVFEVVFVFDPASGDLELSAPGRKKVTTRLQSLFCSQALGMLGLPNSPSPPPLRLDLLKNSDFAFPTEPDDQITRVELLFLKLHPVEAPSHIVTFQIWPSVFMSLHDWMNRWQMREGRTVEDLWVAEAKLRFTWRAKPRQRPRVTLVRLAAPDTIALDDLPEHQIIRRYLKTWNLAA